MCTCIYAHFRTGKGDQRRDLSWWPKVKVWEGSCLNLGCWTPACEAWFQNRLGSIKSGKAQPYSATKWQKNLRLAKHASKFFMKMEGIGLRFLVNDCTIQNP